MNVQLLISVTHFVKKLNLSVGKNQPQSVSFFVFRASSKWGVIKQRWRNTKSFFFSRPLRSGRLHQCRHQLLVEVVFLKQVNVKHNHLQLSLTAVWEDERERTLTVNDSSSSLWNANQTQSEQRDSRLHYSFCRCLLKPPSASTPWCVHCLLLHLRLLSDPISFRKQSRG